MYTQFSTNKSYNLQTKGKLNIKRDNIVEHNVVHTMVTRNMNSVQWLLTSFFINFHTFSFFHIFAFPNSC